jgi:hypothetical protein
VIPPLLINVAKDPEVFPKITAIIEDLIDQYEIDSPDTMGKKYKKKRCSHFFKISQKAYYL